MAKTKVQKKQMIAEYVTKINDSNALFVISPTSLTPNEANGLRKKLRVLNASFNVVKNSLIKRALQEAGKEQEKLQFSNENAVIFCKQDASEGAKILNNFIEEVKKGEIKGGFLDGDFLTKEDIEELAKLPSKEIMIGITIGAIGAPISGFVNALNGNIVNFLNVLKNISESKEKK
ncbi:50S ribosomal protein L10 [Candidatus Dojkabacteria bacterium]|nr:50S ribosomal protein L10 [Candidatus Dojkabacteria bacterium]